MFFKGRVQRLEVSFNPFAFVLDIKYVSNSSPSTVSDQQCLDILSWCLESGFWPAGDPTRVFVRNRYVFLPLSLFFQSPELCKNVVCHCRLVQHDRAGLQRSLQSLRETKEGVPLVSVLLCLFNWRWPQRYILTVVLILLYVVIMNVLCSLPGSHGWRAGGRVCIQGCSPTFQTQNESDRTVLHEEGMFLDIAFGYETSHARLHVSPGRKAEEQQSHQRSVHPVSDWDPVSVEGSGQLLHWDAADHDTRQLYSAYQLGRGFWIISCNFDFVFLQRCRW